MPDSAVLPDLIQESLRRPSYRLRFAPALEARFARHGQRARCRRLGFCIMLALAIYDLTLVTDASLLGDVWVPEMIYQLGLVTPLALLSVWYLLRDPHPIAREVLGPSLGLLCQAGTLWVFSQSASPDAGYSGTSLIVIIVYANAVLRARFVWSAIFTALATFGSVPVLLIARTLSPAAAQEMSLYLVATAIATLYANHSIEYAERQSYLLRLEQAQKAAALDRLNASLAVTSTTDWVTGIDNRRGFQTKLEEACRLAQRSQRPLALALIDIDHFKAYNDTHGHPAGDACLAAVARLLRTGIRAGTDTLARYGGEEFAVILPGADLALALLAGERLRQAVARAELPHGGGGNGPFVSISIGVASAGVGAGAGAGPAPVAARLLEAADQALYRAKKTGRDRVEAADCC